MKILITTDWYVPCINGVVTSVLNLQKELLERGHDVRVLTLSQTIRSETSEDVTRIGSVGIGKLYPGARFKIHFFDGYVRDIIAWRPEVIHSQCEFSTFFIARKIAKKCNAPIIHTYHTVYEDYTHYFSPNKKWGRHMVAFLSRRILNQTAGVIAPTEKVRAILTGYGIKQKIDVIPSGIELHRFGREMPAAQKRLRKAKLDIPEENRVLLYVGRLAKEKNLEELFRYCGAVNQEGLTLLIVGDGPHRPALMRFAEECGISHMVRFAGMIPPEEIGDIYQMGDIFVSASTSETQGLTYMEALASGLPLLCRKDACLDGIVVEGENGWLYENQQDFLSKLDLLCHQEDTPESMASAAAWASQVFSRQAFAEKVEKVYHTAACQSARRTASSYQEEFL